MQLALVGSMAHDDPEGWDYYNRTVEHADGDPDIYILSNMNNVGAVEVNAFQVHSRRRDPEVDQGGLRPDGHGGALEGRPTVAGHVGGIVAQINDGETGWLVDSSRSAPTACIEILRDPEARARALQRQGACAPALPDAATPARLARAVQPARRQ